LFSSNFANFRQLKVSIAYNLASLLVRVNETSVSFGPQSGKASRGKGKRDDDGDDDVDVDPLKQRRV